MRILHVLDHSLPLHSGYAFRTVAILAQQRARGWETFHLTGPRHHAGGPEREQADGWHFHRTARRRPALQRLPLVRDLAQMDDLAARLDALVGQVRPHVLHAHSPVLNALPTLRVGRRHGLPVVYEVRAFWEDAGVSHGSHAEGSARYRAIRALETWALRRADAVTTICEGLRGDIVARGVPAAKVTVIPNAVDVDTLSGAGQRDKALATRLGLAGKVVLGFFGSFYAYEGLHLLLRALPLLTAAGAAVHVLLVGGGPEEQALKRQAHDMGIDDRVTFVGRVPHAEIDRYYDLADLLVYPRVSIRLTELVTPLKPLEAMAQERIVLASDVGGHRELIRDGDTGWLFRPDDAQALADKVVECLARGAEWPAMRRRGRQFVEKERNWRASVARYRQVYGRLVPQMRMELAAE